MHALIVGGTGMLKEVSLTLNKKDWITSIVGRTENRMNAIVKEAAAPDKISGILADWNDTHQFLSEINRTVEENGPINLVVYWSAAPALIPFLDLMDKVGSGPWDFYHVKGSRASRPESRNVPTVPKSCHYHEVILGFKREGEFTRWLTHEEIAAGVVDALESQKDQTIIGTVEPWEMRPSW